MCLQVIRLAERRLRRLQQLYLGQFDRLQHVLKSKRRTYLLEVAREKETMSECSLTSLSAYYMEMDIMSNRGLAGSHNCCL